MSGQVLFDRELIVQVGPYGGQGREWRDLRMEFDIERVDVGALSSGTVKIFNLSPESRGFVEQFGILPQKRTGEPYLIPGQVIVKAGYKGAGGAQTIFTGHIQPIEGVTIRRDITDIITEITAVDGGGFASQSVTALHSAAPTTTADLVRVLAGNLGVSVSPSIGALPVVQWPRGWSFTGPTRRGLDELCRAINAKWSIQDGLLVVTQAGQPTTEAAPLLTPETGLVGSPERLDGGRRIRFTALLNPALRPRRQVRIKSVGFDGNYILQKVRFVGDNGYTPRFHCVCEGLSTLWANLYRTDDGFRQ